MFTRRMTKVMTNLARQETEQRWTPYLSIKVTHLPLLILRPMRLFTAMPLFPFAVKVTALSFECKKVQKSTTTC